MYVAALASMGTMGVGFRETFENKSVDDIIAERKAKGIKPSYVPKPVPKWAGDKKMSRKQRKTKSNGRSNK